jgi:long-chain acyl-CoA synthetase
VIKQLPSASRRPGNRGGNRANRIADLVNHWAATQPDAPAVADDDGSWTFLELQRCAGRAAAWLREQGVRPGDRLSLVGQNCRAFVAFYLGAASLDAWPVLLHANQNPADIKRIHRHAGARCMIRIAAGGRAPSRASTYAPAWVDLGDLGQVASSDFDRAAESEPVPANPAERVAALIYTSGSEGEPKGVMLTNANLLFTARISGRLRRLAPGERMYGVLPMTHSLGLSVVALGTLFHGATLRQAARFDPAAAMAALGGEGITVLIGMPMMYRLLGEYARRKGILRATAPALRVMSVAGAPLTEEIKAEAEALFGIALHNGYGVTECSPTIAQTRLEAPRHDCSVGPVWPGIEVRLDNASPKDGGEIRVRGPNVMKGYYRDPDLTASVLDPEGWFNTRDLGRFDEQGNLFVVGRSRELINRFGYKVMPGEIEAVLDRHPNIARSAVLGHAVAGTEEIIAFVEPAAEKEVSESSLASWCAQHLSAPKRPSKFILVREMPVTQAGKIRKPELMRHLSADVR